MLYKEEKEELSRLSDKLQAFVEEHAAGVKALEGAMMDKLRKIRRELFERQVSYSAQVAKAPPAKEPLVLEPSPAEKPRKARKHAGKSNQARQAAKPPARLERLAPAYMRNQSLFRNKARVGEEVKAALRRAKARGWSWNAMGDCVQVNSKFVWRFIVGDRNGEYDPVEKKRKRVPQEVCNLDELMRLELFLDHADHYASPRKGGGEPKFPFKQLEEPLERLLKDDKRMAALGVYRSRARYTVRTGLADLKRTPVGACDKGVGRGLLWLIDNDPELHEFMGKYKSVTQALEIPASSQGTPYEYPRTPWRQLAGK